jgi:hypothetical protein
MAVLPLCSFAVSWIPFSRLADSERPAMSLSLDRLVIVVRHAIWIGVQADDAEDKETGLLG